jgi:uncharacterized protein
MRLIVLLALLTSSCVAPEGPVRSLLEERQEQVIIQKWDTSCGAAALATLLTYHVDYPISEEETAKGMMRQTDPLKVKIRGGFSLLDMKRFAGELGLPSDGYTDVGLDDLSAMAPVIVPIRVRGYDHFVVVKRVHDDRVFIADPGFGNYELSADSFSKSWAQIGFKVGVQ